MQQRIELIVLDQLVHCGGRGAHGALMASIEALGYAWLTEVVTTRRHEAIRDGAETHGAQEKIIDFAKRDAHTGIRHILRTLHCRGARTGSP